MPIKVKHEGNVTSRIAASAQGGLGKARLDAAQRLQQQAAAENMAGNRQLNGAHASPVSPGQAHAQMISAPSGAVAGGGFVHAPGPSSLGGGSLRRSSAAAGSASTRGGLQSDDYKITGTSVFERPDDESQWDPGNGGRWIRKWLPGEKEAEAEGRIGAVRNDLAAERQRTIGDIRGEQAQTAYTAKQKADWSYLNEQRESIQQSDRYTDEEKRQLLSQIDARQTGIKPLPQLPTMTPEQSFRANTFTMPNGQVWSRDGKLVYNPLEAESKQRELDLKRQDVQAQLEMKRQDMLEKRRQDFYTRMLSPYKESVPDPDDPQNTITRMSTRSMEDVDALWEKLNPTPQSAYPLNVQQAANPGMFGQTMADAFNAAGSQATPPTEMPEEQAAVVRQRVVNDDGTVTGASGRKWKVVK